MRRIHAPETVVIVVILDSEVYETFEYSFVVLMPFYASVNRRSLSAERLDKSIVRNSICSIRTRKFNCEQVVCVEWVGEG